MLIQVGDVDQMAITANGKIGMGGTTGYFRSLANKTEDYSLYVVGGIRTEKVRVELQENWPTNFLQAKFRTMATSFNISVTLATKPCFMGKWFFIVSLQQNSHFPLLF